MRSPEALQRAQEANRAWHHKLRARGLCNRCRQPMPPGSDAWAHTACAREAKRRQRAARALKSSTAPLGDEVVPARL